MFYFVRTVILYLVVFCGIALGVQWALVNYYLPSKGIVIEDVSEHQTIFTMPPIEIQPRTTETGLLLSGLMAQNRRDWGQAWQSFSKFNTKFENQPDIALRAFTLALGNGEFDEALALAEELDAQYFSVEDEETLFASYDLARLFMVLNAIRSDDFELARAKLDTMQAEGSLARFSVPVIKEWLFPGDTILNIDALNDVQIYYLALASEFHGNKDQAMTLMDAIKNDFSSVDQLRLFASLYHRLGEEDKAVELIKNGAAMFAGNMEIIALEEKAEAGDFDAIALDYATFHMKSEKTGVALAFHDFARAMLGERAVDSALLFANMASFLDPTIPSVFVTIGEILEIQEQEQAAMEAYEKVPSTDPQYHMAVAKRINILMQKDDYDTAYNVMNVALENDPQNPYYHYLMGDVHRAMENFPEAIKFYDMAEALGKEDGDLERELWPLYYARAIAFDFSDRWDDAEKDLMTAIEKFPNNPVILNYLGYSYADKNINLEKAKEMISMALMAAPTDAYIIDSMGWILYRMGEYKAAIRYLERAAMLRPYHMVINAHLGDAYWKVGRKLEAKYMWQRAVDYYDDTNEEQRRMIDETRRKVIEGM